MIKYLFIIFSFLFFNFSSHAIELIKVEANGNFDRVDVWSGKFIDLSGNLWDTSEYYFQENESFNASLFFNHKYKKLSITSKIFLDNGYNSSLIDVDPLYYMSLSAKYHLGENKKLKVVLDPIIKFGGGVTESPCYDDFRRAFHCGTGMSWSDAQSGGFLKKYDQDQSINISYSVSF
jgi:hypothetical protein